MQIRSIDKYFAERGIPLKLQRHEDYHYFVYDDGKIFETHSEYVNRLNQLTFEQWIKIGEAFHQEVLEKYKED